MTWNCPSCNCDRTAEIVLRINEENKHYSRIVCSGCERFVKWGKHPKTVERENQLQAKLNQIQDNAHLLTDWEAQFIVSVVEQRKHSPKQLEIIDRIFGKCQEGAA